MNTIPLPGCNPEPLMNYLKSLGVLRIIADRQTSGPDANARASWRNGVFTLHTKLDLEQIHEFLLSEFRPAPILSPWLGGGGFLSNSGASTKLLDSFSASESDRLAELRNGIRNSRGVDVLHHFGELRDSDADYRKRAKSLTDEEKDHHKAVKAEMKQLKESIIFDLRNQVPDAALPWLDTCLTGDTNAIRNAPHMGTGGNIGKLDISTNYLKNLELILDQPARSRDWLTMSLDGTNSGKLEHTSVSQFAPGMAGGANATQGTEGKSAINPWDFVLMMEGSLFLAGSTSRKLGSTTAGGTSFPFTVKSSPIGADPMALGDDAKSKGELWLPLWHRAYSLQECRHLFAEGRSELSRKRSATGLDFARSVANLGVDRGIDAFTRFFFVEYVRAGSMAIPVGRFDVTQRNDAARFQEIDHWLRIYRRGCGDKAPARFRASLREIESTIFDFCRFGNKEHGCNRFQRVLIALGRAERLASKAPRFRDKEAAGLQPLGPLSAKWVRASDDGSPEFRVALALSSIRSRNTDVFRSHLEDIARRDSGNGFKWKKNHAAVWSGGTLTANLERVLSRRVMEGKRAGASPDEAAGEPSHPENPDLNQKASGHPLSATHRVPLGIVADFLSGRLDDQRIADLIWGLSLCRIDHYRPRSGNSGDPQYVPLPPAYSLLKILYCDNTTSDDDGPIMPDTTILGLLRAGRIPVACQRAVRRLRGKRLLAMPQAMNGYRSRDDEWNDAATSGLDPTRLAAALFIPIGHSASAELQKRILRPHDESEP
jgi:CRISPR-associated protein Csx17